MKHPFIFIFALGIVFLFSSCENDDDSLDLGYQISFLSPESNLIHLGETLHIQVNFEELEGGIIYNVNIRIYNGANGTEIYNKPDDPSIQITDGTYTFEDDFILEGLDTDAVWILEAKAWGEEDGAFEVSESMEILIDP